MPLCYLTSQQQQQNGKKKEKKKKKKKKGLGVGAGDSFFNQEQMKTRKEAAPYRQQEWTADFDSIQSTQPKT